MRRLLAALLVLAALLLHPVPASAATAKINGAGSSYVALAMQQWVADAQTAGLNVNYLPSGSPQGMTSYGQSLVDFAATEAEFSALQATGGEQQRGFQYVPDVAGATAVLYHANNGAGQPVTDLHLSMRTIARIFTGDIARWSDPAITENNAGRQLPDQPITVVYRSGQSGTTGTFYDFIAHVAPDLFDPWATKHQLPEDVRIIQLDGSPDFAPKTQAFNGSDQIAQHIAGSSGLWSIGYDEFGYAKTYGAAASWVKNTSGAWVLPYAENISAALNSATLRPDLSQELSKVYTSPDPLAYPISAYSYVVTQCASAGDRATCKGSYANPGITETLAKWLRYIACDGQINMAQIGYSPLPPVLSQELVNSIARLQGTTPETLSASNCSNPRFKGNLGSKAASPPDPLANAQKAAAARTAAASGGSARATSGGVAQTAAATGGPTVATTPVAGVTSATTPTGQAVTDAAPTDEALGAAPVEGPYRPMSPVVLQGRGAGRPAALLALGALVLILAPAALLGRRRRRTS